MIEKLKTLNWFLRRPNHWQHAVALMKRKMQVNYDSPPLRQKAMQWAADRAVPYPEALQKLGITGETRGLSPKIIEAGQERAAKSLVKMGGPGDLNLLFDSVCLTQAQIVLETGVAYGWSSLSILNGMAEVENAKLFSVDMPYPKMANDRFVGLVVPDSLRAHWTLIREPDRNGIRKALAAAGGQIDLCHYDSDKSYWGRAYAFPLLWEALRSGGLFISDDIQDNMFFAEFAQSKKVAFAITKSDGKFVGLMRKP